MHDAVEPAIPSAGAGESVLTAGEGGGCALPDAEPHKGPGSISAVDVEDSTTSDKSKGISADSVALRGPAA